MTMRVPSGAASPCPCLGCDAINQDVEDVGNVDYKTAFFVRECVGRSDSAHLFGPRRVMRLRHDDSTSNWRAAREHNSAKPAHPFVERRLIVGIGRRSELNTPVIARSWADADGREHAFRNPLPQR